MTRLEKLIALKNNANRELYWEVASQAENFGVSFSVQLDREITAEEKIAASAAVTVIEKAEPVFITDENIGVECIKALGNTANWDEKNEWLNSRGYAMTSIYRAVRLGLLEEEIVDGRVHYSIV